MNVKPILFNWEQIGTHEGEPILNVNCFGHKAEIFKAFDNKLWRLKIDGRVFRGIESEKLAIEMAEATIRKKISERITHAKKELSLLTDFFNV